MNIVLSEAVESLEQLCTTWGRIVLDCGTGFVKDEPGLAIRWADSQFPFWNCITITDQVYGIDLLRERFTKAVDFMRGQSRPGLIWFFEDLLTPDARAELSMAVEQAGLECALSGYGMAGDILPIAQPLHPELEFVRVTTDELLLAYADINARAYAMPLENVRDGLAGSPLWKSEMHTYLGLENGVPVSAAATIENDGSLFLALVATNPDAQRKGYGEATVRKALYEGWKATGLTRSVLHATMAGAPVYERIGYRKVASMKFYGLKAQ